ncbi:MAG: tetratricopeptide repeat protein [Treponema sp.]|nr:tetratricopeptide repeat protein [Treponema sp.]
MNPASPLDTIYYIKLPENFKLSRNAMHIDPTIPVPVQKKDRDAPGTFDPGELTQEQILAGILTVLAYDPQNEHTGYYRSVLKEARPEIKKELSEAAILKAKNEDYDIAEEIFAALRGFDPEDMVTVLNTALFLDERANSYRRSGLNEDADAYDHDALEYYRQAMDADPAIPDAFFNAGFFYMKQHNFHDAKDSFETYLALTCDMKDEELGENGIYKKERSQEILDNIKSQNMDDEHFKAAYDYISSGQETKGLDEIKIFIKSNPHVWNAWFMLGWGLRRLERYADAKQAFLEALNCPGGDHNSDTYNELAICCMEEKNFKEAKKCLENALSLEPESTKIMSNLGYLALKQGNTEEAQKYFTSALAYDPDDKIAKAELEKLEKQS